MASFDMMEPATTEFASSSKFKVFTRSDIDRLPQLLALPEEVRLSMKAVAAVLPFRVNNYVVDELIDWDNIPDDPIYQLTFPAARDAREKRLRADARARSERRVPGDYRGSRRERSRTR